MIQILFILSCLIKDIRATSGKNKRDPITKQPAKDSRGGDSMIETKSFLESGSSSNCKSSTREDSIRPYEDSFGSQKSGLNNHDEKNNSSSSITTKGEKKNIACKALVNGCVCICVGISRCID